MSKRLQDFLENNKDIVDINEFNEIRNIGELVDCKEFDFTNIENLANTLKRCEKVLLSGENPSKYVLNELRMLRKSFVYDLAVLKEDMD